MVLFLVNNSNDWYCNFTASDGVGERDVIAPITAGEQVFDIKCTKVV